MTAVLDASAFLAYLRGERGAERVIDVLAEGAVISTVNLAEVLSKRAEAGDDPEALATRLIDAGLLLGAVDVTELLLDDAVAVAQLRTATKQRGLSLGDRACLAVARRLAVRAVTADTAWADLDVGVEIETIR
jgi:PIN domain nuclease of toxin-antitoxin system